LGTESPLLFDANPLAMWVHDPDTLRILAVNEAAVRQYGWTRAQLLAMARNEPAFFSSICRN
jgi:PAS domain-containing protein